MANFLSQNVTRLVAGGATAIAILSAFLYEKEGNKLAAYQDGSGHWTICAGLTRYDDHPVKKGLILTAEQCEIANKQEFNKSLRWVKDNAPIKLTNPQLAAVASFCPYNLGVGKCQASTFWRKLNYGDITGACSEIKRWIYDGGRNCAIRSNQCYGQVLRRQQESELLCWGA